MDASEKVSAFIAVLVTVGCFVLLALGVPVPDWVSAGFGLVLGFFFGNQSALARARAR